jgi:hypothetical protein
MRVFRHFGFAVFWFLRFFMPFFDTLNGLVSLPIRSEFWEV